jgi:N-acetylglucosamine kinase-like BadF-type ATPase
MKYFLGIDVGSSKTHALIADETGRCVGFGQARGGNHQGGGYDGFQAVVKESTEQACAQAGISIPQLAGAGFGVAGYDFPSDRAPHLEAIATLGFTCPVEIMNDGGLGLLAGATDGIGVNVTAGSSNNCRGRNRDGREGRIVGNGSYFGEYGGGIEVIVRALQMVNYAWIKRHPPTALTQVLLSATGAKDEMDLMEGLSNGTYRLHQSQAILVIETARRGDAAAAEVIRWAGEELGWLAIAAARQIGLENDALEVILAGSLFQAGEIIIQPMRETVLRHCPHARLIRLDGPPVLGAVILGMEQAHFDGYAVRNEMVRSAKDIMA